MSDKGMEMTLGSTSKNVHKEWHIYVYHKQPLHPDTSPTLLVSAMVLWLNNKKAWTQKCGDIPQVTAKQRNILFEMKRIEKYLY